MNSKITNSIFTFLFLLLTVSTIAQSHYPGMFLVSFTDKNQSPYSVSNPKQFLSSRAIERRAKASIAIIEQDLPVNPFYIDSLNYYGAQSSFSSRWLNAVLIRMDDSLRMQELLHLSFVDSMQYLAPVKNKKSGKSSKRYTKRHAKTVETGMQEFVDEINYGASYQQLDLIGLTALHKLQYLGEGIQIAVLDNGFRGLDKMKAFNQLFENGQLLGTKDIASPKGSVFKAGNHGTYVMTTMAAYDEGVLVGSAPGASYWLIHTEDNDYEYPIEEFNWAVGVEFADSAGVDIITSSLIYSTFDDSRLNHSHDELDGKTAIISRAAQTATEKGVLVFNSAGNDATNAWHKIAFPADAKDVMTIGAVNIEGKYAKFSSVGYTVDDRIKPNVVAVGDGTKSISPNTGELISINGTSFSNPTIAGAAAILLQANPNASMDDIRSAIELSASQNAHPDSLLGYGIPNFYLAHIILNNGDMPNMEDVEGFTLMPNPFIDDLYILYTSSDSQEVVLQAYDISGKLVFESNIEESQPGVNLIKVNQASTLGQGMYVMVLFVNGQRYTRKLVRK